jgi:hypothetical protein
LNRTEPKTGSNRLLSVRFGSVFFHSKPVQTQWSSTNTIHPLPPLEYKNPPEKEK